MQLKSHTMPPQANALLDLVRAISGTSLAGLYLHGSFVGSGLQELSDLDFILVVKRPLSEAERQAFLRDLLSLSAHHPARVTKQRCLDVLCVTANELQRPSYPGHCEFIYGEWLREGFEAGAALAPFIDPVVTLLVAQAREEAVPLHGPPLADLADQSVELLVPRALLDSLAPLLADLQWDQRNVLLTLARMLRTAIIGDFVSKDAAALWAAERLPSAAAHTLRQCGLAYRGKLTDWQARPDDAEELADHLGQKITEALTSKHRL
ncbi:aminoglycoside nucleotidyltransferase ANT9 [Devosia pacifica]|uniref:Aminoglycoside (3'') (9) adenylyltransferase n=1 Tax=Devosia pacifica TaxID=1335967 RepID=A0A918SE26_9HYPH|nr:aminoglycoside adenylyltransferase domain-containing protein [Devosia pacifica]GHA37163.1 aminoglycoside nucleotidyltransferase ANT9 [Devosia pacifica]